MTTHLPVFLSITTLRQIVRSWLDSEEPAPVDPAKLREFLACVLGKLAAVEREEEDFERRRARLLDWAARADEIVNGEDEGDEDESSGCPETNNRPSPSDRRRAATKMTNQ